MSAAAEVIRQHARVDRGCACGWGAWGSSHAKHVAAALAEAGHLAGAELRDVANEAIRQKGRALDAEAVAVEQRERAETAEEQVVRLTAERDRWPAAAHDTLDEAEAQRDDARLVAADAMRDRDEWRALATVETQRAAQVGQEALAARKRCAELEAEQARIEAHGRRRIDEARRVSRQRDRLRAELDGLRQVVAVSGSEYRRVTARVDTARARLYLALGHDQHPTARTLAVHVLAALEPQESRP